MHSLSITSCVFALAPFIAILTGSAHAAALPEQAFVSRQEEAGIGMGIAEIVNTVKDYLKDKNAYVGRVTISNDMELVLIFERSLSPKQGGSRAKHRGWVRL